MTTPHQPDRFTFATFPGMNPVFVNDTDRQDDLHTAYAWCLHVRVPTDEYGTGTPAAGDFFTAIMASVPVGTFPWLRADASAATPAAVGGDSFTAWCEPFTDDGDDARALHLYFGSPEVEIARNLALAFMVRTGLTPYDVALSTAGDWAEQAPLPVTA